MPVRAPLDCALAEPVYVVPVIAFRCAAAVLLAGALGAPVLADEVAAAPAPERAEQVAKLLGLHPPVAAEPDQALARLRARTQALLQIERLSLRIDGTMARIEREQFEAANARQNLDSRSGKTATTYNLVAVLVGSGTTALGTALQFGNDNEIRAGYGIIIGGAAIAAAFTIAALVQKQRGKTHFPIRTDLLAQLFDRAPSSPELRLPEPIWRYLDTKLVGQPASFRRQLLDRFTHEGRLSLAATPAAQRTIDLLSRPIARGEVVPSDVLALRADMLSDLRSRVANMKIDLELLASQLAESGE